jgi:hypothetical protein
MGIRSEYVDDNNSVSKPNNHGRGNENHQDRTENNGHPYEVKSLSVDEYIELESKVGSRHEDERRSKHGMENPDDNGDEEHIEVSDTKLSKDIDKHEMKIINDDPEEEEENEEPIKLSDADQSKDLYAVPENVIDEVAEAVA